MASIIPMTGLALSEFTPTELREHQPPIKFWLRTPTFALRDQIVAVLFAAGFHPATQTQSRGLLIEGLFKLYDEAEADSKATFLEEFWLKQDLHNEILQAWQIQEAERLFDEAHGAPRREPEAVPASPYSMRDQARQAAIVTQVLENDEAYCQYQARFLTQQEEENAMLARLFVAGWDNIPVDCHIDRLGRVDPDSIEQLRGWFQENGAHKAWEEIRERVRALFNVPGGLEKNFGSPLDTSSSQDGSQASSGELATSDGNSTELPTTPTPSSGSAATSSKSRSSRFAKKSSTGTNGRTGGRSSNSQKG